MKRNHDRYYLAYGSNLNIDQMLTRCPGAKEIGVAEIKNYRLMFKGSKTGSYLTIEPYEGMSVPVGVWKVTPMDEHYLDLYEGFPTFYYKKEMKVMTRLFGFFNPAAENIDAFVYIMHENRPFGLPTKSYVQTCVEGYDAFGFSKKYLKDAVDYSKKMIAETANNA